MVTVTAPDSSPFPTYTVLGDVLLFCIIIGVIVYWLHGRGKTQQAVIPSDMPLSPTAITVILLLLAMFGPMALNIYPRVGNDPIFYLAGMSWMIIALTITDSFFGFMLFLQSIPFAFLRLVFVYQIYRYYRRKSSRKRTIIVGVLSEIQITIIGIIILPLTLVYPFLAIMIPVPIPLLLLTALGIMRYVPVPGPPDGWSDLEEKQEWWNTEAKSSSGGQSMGSNQ
ncbi:MAG: hypothetical protein ACFE7R_09900 [Candidatus Hodarchaeota archaeon]